MVLTRFALVAFLTSSVASCSAVQNLADKDKDKKDESGDAASTSEDPNGGDDKTTAEEKADDPLDEQTKLGLAEFCTFEKSDKGEGCFTCTPRDLPNTKCTNIPADFDPAKMCKHDLDQMSCDLGGTEEWVYDFGEESKDEKLYNKIPLLLFGAKALLSEKLADNAELKELIFGALDVVDKYKKDIFTNGSLDPMVDELAAIVKKAKPEFDQGQIDDFKAQAKATIKAMQDKRASGKLDTAGMLSTFTDVLNQLPPDLVAPVLENLELDKIIGALTGSGGGGLEDLLGAFGGTKSIEDIIAGLQIPDGTGTGTGSGSGSGS
jgi:hypothetical protein